MRSLHLVVILALATPMMSVAQGAPATGASEAAPDTAPPAPKKKGGLFGKMKGFSKNHFVNTVAKTALCTAVPGGSILASAMDAKKAKNAKDVAGAAANAAGAAANVAGGTGGTCMPVMGLAAKAEAAAGVTGVPGAGIPGLPTTGLSQAALSAAQMQQAKSTPGAAMTPEQMKQMQEQYRKMGMKPEQIAVMQAQMQAMQQTMAQASRASGETPAAPAASPAAVPARASQATAGTEPALTTEEGHFVLRGIAWDPRSAVVQAGSESSFTFAMHDLAAALQASGKRYRVVPRVEEQGKKSLNFQLAQQRASAVIAGLVAQGVPADHLTAGDGKSDKDARVLIQEIK